MTKFGLSLLLPIHFQRGLSPHGSSSIRARPGPGPSTRSGGTRCATSTSGSTSQTTRPVPHGGESTAKDSPHLCLSLRWCAGLQGGSRFDQHGRNRRQGGGRDGIECEEDDRHSRCTAAVAQQLCVCHLPARQRRICAWSQGANMRHQLAGDKSSRCPKLESWAAGRKHEAPVSG